MVVTLIYILMLIYTHILITVAHMTQEDVLLSSLFKISSDLYKNVCVCVYYEDDKMNTNVSTPTQELEHSQTTETLGCFSLVVISCPPSRVTLSEFCVYHSIVFFKNIKSGFGEGFFDNKKR